MWGPIVAIMLYQTSPDRRMSELLTVAISARIVFASALLSSKVRFGIWSPYQMSAYMTTAALGCFFAFALVFSAVMSLLTCFFKVARSLLVFAMSDLLRRKAERCSNEIKYQHVLDDCRCCPSNVHIPNKQSFVNLSISAMKRVFFRELTCEVTADRSAVGRRKESAGRYEGEKAGKTHREVMVRDS